MVIAKKYYEEHREAITLCKAAKDAFSQIEGTIPKIKNLNQEYNEVLQEKKKTYSEYRQARQDMKDYQTAKYNVDQFLKTDDQSQQEAINLQNQIMQMRMQMEKTDQGVSAMQQKFITQDIENKGLQQQLQLLQQNFSVLQ